MGRGTASADRDANHEQNGHNGRPRGVEVHGGTAAGRERRVAPVGGEASEAGHGAPWGGGDVQPLCRATAVGLGEGNCLNQSANRYLPLPRR